jgi:hypothetical protein
MAKYVIMPDKREKYQKDYKFPCINIIPAFVWSIPIHQKLFSEAPFWAVALLTIAFIFVYLYVSLTPIIAAAPCIASVVMFTTMAWVPLDGVGNNMARSILKIVALVVIIVIEFAIWGNATLPWLESKTNKPTIKRVED